MRKTHNFEIVGIGEFDEFPAKAKKSEYPIVNKDGKPLFKKVISQGISSEYGYTDADNNLYQKSEIFYDIKGRLVQKVNRTEKVPKWEIVDLSEVTDLLDDISKSFLDCNESSFKSFNEKVPAGKAVKFSYKKSSTGLNWVVAYAYNDNGTIAMTCGIGKYSEAKEEFKKYSRNKNTNKELPNNLVEVDASDIDPF